VNILHNNSTVIAALLLGSYDNEYPTL